MKRWGRVFLGIVLILLLAACAGERYHREGLNLLSEGKPEEGLSKLESAVQEDPSNAQFKSDLLTRRADQINRLLSAAEAERAAAKWDAAEALYKRIQKIEPGNSRAVTGMDALARDRSHAPILENAKDAFKKGTFDRALDMLRPVLSENPTNAEALALKRQIEDLQTKEKIVEPLLQLGQKKPINLEFRDANLKMVFEALARTTGVSFILDKDVRPDLRTTVFLRQSTLEDAIELILQTNRLEKKVLNRNTILVYPNTPEKLKEYQELVVKGFYLANADVKQTQAMIKGLLKTKDTFIDEKLNLLMIRDTPEAIRLAEKLISMHDLSEPEVMLEVEVLEVKRSRLLELGIQFPNQLSLTPLSSGTSTTLSDLKNLNADRLGAAVSGAVINLRREIGDANILANPRVRARNREKAKILIGDKVPVVTTTSTASAVSENVQYLDVGIKLEVEPNVYLQDDVGIKVALEVSSVVREVRTPSGSLAYQIGTRSASTVLRLKDGETQVLAGLIADEDRTAANRVPGLGDLPLLGRLFSSQKDDRNKTEIVLSITPHLIRNIQRPNAATSEFWSGTESSLRTRPLMLQMASAEGGLEVDSGFVKNGNATTGNVATGKDADAKPEVEPSVLTLSLQGPAQVKAGEQFKVVVKVKTDGDVRSLPFQLGYDSTAFQVISIADGNFFKQNEGKSSITSNVDATMGKVFVSPVRSGLDGAHGEGEVAVLTMRALSTKKPAEIKLLTSAPITISGKTMVPVMPTPLTVTIVD